MGTILWGRLMQFKKNYKVFLFMLILPLVFTYAFHLGGVKSQKINIPVVDMDKTTFSAGLLKEVSDLEIYDPVLTEAEQMKKMIQEGNAPFGIIIPHGFSEQLSKEKDPMIQMITVKDLPETASFKGVLASTIQKLQYNQQIVDVSLKSLKRIEAGFDPSPLERRLFQLTEEKWKTSPPIIVSTRVLESENTFKYDHRLQTLLGFTLFFSMYTIIYAVGEILNDKQLGVWDRLIHSPLNKAQLYIGNFIYSFMLGFVQISLIILFGNYVMDIDWGEHLSLVFLVIAMYIMVIMALGMLLVSFVRTPQQLNALVPIVAVSSAMLGGAYWPIEIVTSKLLIILSKAIPITYAMKAIKELALYHRGWEGVFLPVSILFFMAVILMGVGMHLIERKQV